MAYLNSIPGRYWNQGYIIGQVRTKDRLARTGEGHFRQGIMCLLLHLSNFKF